MSEVTSDRDLRDTLALKDPVLLATRLAGERAEDIVERLNRAKPGFVAETLAALPEAQAVEVLDQPQLAHGAAILSDLPPERAARLLDLMSADRAAEAVREMRLSVREELLGKVNPETRAALERLLPYPEGVAGHIMTTVPEPTWPSLAAIHPRTAPPPVLSPGCGITVMPGRPRRPAPWESTVTALIAPPEMVQ